MSAEDKALTAKIGDGNIAKGLSNLFDLFLKYGPSILKLFGVGLTLQADPNAPKP